MSSDVAELERVAHVMPLDWRETAVADVVAMLPGFAFKSENFVADTDAGLSLIRIRDLGKTKTATRYVGSYDEAFAVQHGDILVGMDGGFEAVRWQGGKALLNQRVLKLSSARHDTIDEGYLFYRVQPALSELEQTISGTTVKHLSTKDLKRLIWQLPPLDEQRRIAEVLRSVDEAIAASQATLQQSEVALSALAGDLFAIAMPGDDNEWGQSALEDMLENIIDYRGVPPPKADSGIPLLTAKNVRFGYLDFEPREYIAAKDYDSWMRRGLPSPGDIMFTTEAPLGNVAEFPDIKAALGQRTLTLVPKTKTLDAKFLKWLLLSEPAQDLIWSHATGSTAKGIKQRTFRKLKFGFPALDEQVRIAQLLEDIGAARDAAKRSSEAYAAMKVHLMSDLLSGHVRVPA